jgi:hypothetical protein
VSLYQVNDWAIWVQHQYCNPANYSIMGSPGFEIFYTHSSLERQPSCEDNIRIPKNMFKHIQKVSVVIGGKIGIKEVDIVPTTDQTLLGPERPTFRTVIDRVEAVSQLLRECDKIHFMEVTLGSNESKPKSVGKALEPITRLRGINSSRCKILSAAPNLHRAFGLKISYVRYLSKVMRMPAGAELPKYVPDKNEGQEQNGIFHLLVDESYDSASDDYNDDELFAHEMLGYHDTFYGGNEAGYEYEDYLESMAGEGLDYETHLHNIQADMDNESRIASIRDDNGYIEEYDTTLDPPGLYDMSNGNPPSGFDYDAYGLDEIEFREEARRAQPPPMHSAPPPSNRQDYPHKHQLPGSHNSEGDFFQADWGGLAPPHSGAIRDLMRVMSRGYA